MKSSKILQLFTPQSKTEKIFSVLYNKGLLLSKAWLLPFLLSIYPALLLYGNNTETLVLSSLERTLVFYSVLALVVFIIFFVVIGRQPIKAANASFVFLIFFNTYKLVYDYFYNIDIIQIRHHTFLPFFFMIAFYASWRVTFLNASAVWKTATFMIGTMVFINLTIIIPAEIQKYVSRSEYEINLQKNNKVVVSKDYPDIYFVVFDEAAGFETVRSYWDYRRIDEFIAFVKSKGFFVAEYSQSSSLSTLHQITERLNYQEYPYKKEDLEIYYRDTANNRVMRYLKSLGYTTVVFDETKYFIPRFQPINADATIGYDDAAMASSGILFDNFGVSVADNTMLSAFSSSYKILDPTLQQHKEWIYSTAESMGNLNSISSPKFVYVHYILPHAPFMFYADGKAVDPKLYNDWNYYFGNYLFSLRIAEKIINNILLTADPERMPVIIIQSDHGARNGYFNVPGSIYLKDFPDEYRNNIINIMYIPGYDFSATPQDIKPINTFPLLFNYLFDDKIPLQ